VIVAPSPVKRDIRSIRATIGKLRRNIDKREKLAPLSPPT
jgi:hypothetical protein